MPGRCHSSCGTVRTPTGLRDIAVQHQRCLRWLVMLPCKCPAPARVMSKNLRSRLRWSIGALWRCLWQDRARCLSKAPAGPVWLPTDCFFLIVSIQILMMNVYFQQGNGHSRSGSGIKMGLLSDCPGLWNCFSTPQNSQKLRKSEHLSQDRPLP